MVNVILVGAKGKMGKTIRNMGKDRDDFHIIAGVDKNKAADDIEIFDNIYDTDCSFDVVLDFSRPESLDNLISFCTEKNKPLVICTTGYNEDELRKIEETSKIIPVFKSANMSIGVNVVNNILKNVSAFLYENFDMEIIEKHHNQKVDSPSGTAILFADTIKKSIGEDMKYTFGREGKSKRVKNEIGIHSVRGGSIVGEHEVLFAGDAETIEIKHTAMSREVFGAGAVLACKFMKEKTAGFYNMNDVIEAAGQ